MLTSTERKILVRRSKTLRAEREAIDETIKMYEQEKRDTLAELETMLHLLERDVLSRNDNPTEDGAAPRYTPHVDGGVTWCSKKGEPCPSQILCTSEGCQH